MPGLGLGGLGAAGTGLAGGYNTEYDAITQQLAQGAAYRGLQALSAMNQQMPQGMPPGGPSPPGAGPMPPGPPMAGASPGMGPPPPQAPQMPQGANARLMGQGQVAYNPPPGAPPGSFAGRFPQMGQGTLPNPGQAQAPPGAMPPPPQQQQPQPPQPQGWAPQGMQQGPPDLQRLVQAVSQANPNAPPNVKMAAIEMLTRGILNPQQQLALREMQLLERQNQMGVNAMLKLQQINNQRATQGFPPVTFQEAMQGGMLGAGGGQQPVGGQQAGMQQPGGQPQQGNLFAGVGQANLNRAKALGWDENALAQAATVYQQTGKWPQGLGTRAGAQIVQGIIRDVANNINQQKGMTNEQMTSSWQSYHAEGKFQDTAGTYAARVENATNELEQLIPQAAQASKNWQRTDVVAFNKLYNEYKQGISDPALNDLLVASFGVISAYTRAMNPSGAPRVNDRLETEAINLLSAANGPEAYMTQLRRMWKEAQASKQATYKTGKEGRQPGDINAPMPGDDQAPDQQTQDQGGGIPAGWTVKVH